MLTLKEYFSEVLKEKKAIAHFNFSTADQLKAFVEAAIAVNKPLMVGTSEGEAEFIGYQQAVALVRSWRATTGHPVFLNSDHHRSFETAKKAVDAGYDSIHIDASKLNYEDNVKLTKKVFDYVKSVKPDIMVEGELGYLRGSSKVQERIEVSPNDYTKPEEVKDFVTRTGVDRLAIAFGNIHGLVKNQEMHLDLNLLSEVTKSVPGIFLVLHGGSGLKDEEVRESIKMGITNVHINTELRVAYLNALARQLKEDPDETTPYKFLKPSFEATKKLAEKKINLFQE